MSGCRRLPGWQSVLAVVAHPDDESFGLGAILAGFAARAAAVSVLCFTRGEASTLHGVPGDLAAVRAAEMDAAAHALGIGDVTLLGYPDGRLDQVPVEELAGRTVAAAERASAVGLLVFDPSGVTGHPDHRRATQAALHAAAGLGLPVLGWTLPAEVAAALNAEYPTAFSGHPTSKIDLTITVDRTRQYAAVRRHPSQAVPGSVLWRRLDLLGDTEHLRWLHGLEPADPETRPGAPGGAAYFGSRSAGDLCLWPPTGSAAQGGGGRQRTLCCGEMRTMMYGNWAGWGWMMLMPLLWIALIGVIAWVVVMVVQRPADRAAGQPRRETPQEILDRRFAAGEIDADAYTQARARLAGREPGSR